MKSQDFTTTFKVKASAAQTFAAINNVRDWWSGEIEGDTRTLGDEFTYRQKDIHFSKQRIVELSPNSRIVWRVIESRLNFVDDKQEWNGTRIVFEIVETAEETQVTFTHAGLVRELACFEGCSGGWRFYIDGALKTLIDKGEAR